MADVERLAASLSEPMRVALLRLADAYAWADRRSVKALVARGLAVAQEVYAFSDTQTDWLSAITETGKAVAAYLKDPANV